MELSSKSGSSSTGDDENLTNSDARVPSESLRLSSSSNNSTDNDNHNESGSDNLSQDDPPRLDPITTSLADMRAAEASASEGNVTISPYAYHTWTDPTFSLRTLDVILTSL